MMKLFRIRHDRLPIDNRSRQTWAMAPIVDWLIDMPERRSAVFLWLPPLFARIVVGWVFMWSGWTKLDNLYPTPDFPGMISRFAEWGIPYPERHGAVRFRR